MNTKKVNKIPHSQIRRIMENIIVKSISKKAILKLEELLINEIKKLCKNAKKIMILKKVKTLKPDFFEFELFGKINETSKKISKEPIKRLIHKEKIERIGGMSTEKLINRIVKLIKDITREADLFSDSEGMKTIKERHIEYGYRIL